jgi:hypothetical protein
MHPSANARENDKRGSDLENREKDFAYQAMYELDMPGIGGASGGSGGDLLVTEIFGGITDPEDLQKAAFCSSMEMVRNGYHSFHEAATIARLFGAQYTPGNYASAIPQSWVNALPELKQLQEQFPHLLKYETP